jgi:hypothetical protein
MSKCCSQSNSDRKETARKGRTVERFQVCLGGRSGRLAPTSSMYPSFRFFLATLNARDPEEGPAIPFCGDVSSESEIVRVFGSVFVEGI